MTNSSGERDFEQAVTRLEEIVEKLERDQQLPLEEMIALYKGGLELAEFSQKRLTAAQLEIERITKEEVAVAEALETFVPPGEGAAADEVVEAAPDEAAQDTAPGGAGEEDLAAPAPDEAAAAEGLPDIDAPTLDADIDVETSELGAADDGKPAEGDDPDWEAPEIPF